MDYKLSTKSLHKLNSFFLIIKEDWSICDVGLSMLKIFGSTELKGSVHDYFEITKSPLVFIDGHFHIREDVLYFFTHKRSRIRIKGQIISLDNGDFLIACTPLIAGMKDIGQAGLNLMDFPLQDYFTDAMFLLRSNDKTMIELREYSDKVKEQNVELTAAQRELLEVNERLEDQVKSRTQDLVGSNNYLKETLENLKSTQEKLIESEKMGALGQLISGIAHELNTPIGAIKASVETLQENFQKSLDNNPTEYLSEREYLLYRSLTENIIKERQYFSTREIRKNKKQLIIKLKDLGWTNSKYIAEAMAHMNYFGELPPFEEILQHKSLERIMESLQQAVMSYRMSQLIMTSAGKAEKVISALKSYIHSEENDYSEEVNVAERISKALMVYQNLTSGIHVSTRLETDKPMVLGNKKELDMVWVNIIHNALQAMENSGDLDILISEEGEYLSVSIADSGPGIRKELQSQIFNAFFTTKTEGHGTGLGLHLVKKIVDQYHGKLEFQSEPGKTCFTVLLPMTRKILTPALMKTADNLTQ